MTDITVAVADDQALLRQSLLTVLRLDPCLAVAGEASDGAEAVQLCVETLPDVILMDIQMPVLDGISATSAIVEAVPTTKVLVLTMYDHDDYAYRALRAGASGFLLKDTSPPGIIDAVKAVHGGQSLLAPTALRSLIAHYTPKHHPTNDSPLTGRQTEILRLVGLGLSNDEIQQQLVISRSTLKTHMSAILARLQARDRAQLVIAAYELGLVGR